MNSVTDAHLIGIDKIWSRASELESPLPSGLAAGRCLDGEQALLVERSRQRSQAYGLSGTTEPERGLLAALPQLIEKSRLLHTQALPVMETLHLQIVNTHSMVVLADAGGAILHVIGDKDFLERASRVSLVAGAAWSEQSRGTNAIGTAIEEQIPVSVHASEHYLRANHFLTAAAAPIFDRQGRLIGVLGIAGDERHYQPHTMALARMSAQMIESQLFSARTASPQAADAARTASPQTAPDAWRRTGLRHLKTGDPQVAALVDKAGKILGRGIPILLVGETGTGKELLAQAIHNDSPCAAGPFVAINCASIPETLIEAELFGYEDGAFTGSRKKGSAGKILQADGGTLFLDEIGDMPLNLQAHLLRVLQERVVTPLGSAKSIPVNIEVICATNRNLRELIANGMFRDDLYYRLNGLVLKLPSLRERTDLDMVIDKILKIESAAVPHTVAADVMRLFRGYRWPGNFRQLRSLLRFAVIMAGSEQEIRREHLPDDFLDDVTTAVPSKPAASAEPLIAAGSELEELELAAILKSLEAHGGNVSAASRALGISRNTIYRKIGGR